MYQTIKALLGDCLKPAGDQGQLFPDNQKGAEELIRSNWCVKKMSLE